MINSEVILEVKDLEVAFHVRSGITHAVNGISYTLHKGETLGIVGESGCGKTVSSMALLKLISIPPGKIEKGSAIYQGKTDLSITKSLAEQIIAHVENKDDLFIPQYEEVFKHVLARYHEDFRKEGLHSYEYKVNSGRI